ncbi:cytochrome c oxidase subunit II [Sulfobacillus harzensis]|uniref:Cytochrome c oxidase subunit II n=1 Tax=Sulfobacillus harzensis TaxID=2729629 RepID=A0A7Y0Q3D2_9FIRM|nr:cytochrome c oxidase subunit II [Sulfobacillus harzensis]NMP23270.1 cytochrome c oxidase subunit II [Sulfobacillus harzensis]
MFKVRSHHLKWVLATLLAGGASTACSSDYVVFHPAGPVAQSELNLIVLSTIVIGVICVLIWVLWAYVLIRFRDTPGNKAPYWPTWRHNRILEVGVFVIPVVALLIIAIPTVQKTVALDHVPTRHPMLVDVTSLDYKWLFEYPGQRIATVNYVYVPVGRPVLFQLTANSPLGAFWAPNLGGMEYTMPNRVLPLWLEATRPGVFRGRNANFSGVDFWRMSFKVHAVPKSTFQSWVHDVKSTAPPMTQATWKQLLRRTVTPPATYSSYPVWTFPERPTQFTVKGLHYVPTHKP